MRRATLLGLLLAVAGFAGTARAATLALRDADGIHVDATDQIDARQLDVGVTTDALMHPIHVRILLPADYASATPRRYPVLYLFHGTSGRASDWVNFGNAAATTADLPLIVVMPDAGFDGDGGGWFADWFNGGAGGQPMWETFHVGQLIPWIDDNLRTIARRDGRAVAGLSQGGFGALSYAARHPELFTSVASFSGGCVIDRDPQAIAISTSIIEVTTSILDGVADKDAIFGPRATQELNWQSHDPGTLVTNLRGMQIALWTGDGTPGPFDHVPVDQGASSIEQITFGATRLFDGYLTEAGIEHAYHYYGGGTHTFAYWARDLAEYVGPLMARFRRPPSRPRSVGYLTTADRWRQFGWEVALERPAPAFDELRDARRRGFVVRGGGRARVRTPRLYRAGTHLQVREKGPAVDVRRDLVVGPGGRLRLAIPLGDDAATPTRVVIRTRRSP